LAQVASSLFSAVFLTESSHSVQMPQLSHPVFPAQSSGKNAHPRLMLLHSALEVPSHNEERDGRQPKITMSKLCSFGSASQVEVCGLGGHKYGFFEVSGGTVAGFIDHLRSTLDIPSQIAVHLVFNDTRLNPGKLLHECISFDGEECWPNSSGGEQPIGGKYEYSPPRLMLVKSAGQTPQVVGTYEYVVWHGLSLQYGTFLSETMELKSDGSCTLKVGLPTLDKSSWWVYNTGRWTEEGDGFDMSATVEWSHGPMGRVTTRLCKGHFGDKRWTVTELSGLNNLHPCVPEGVSGVCMDSYGCWVSMPM